MILALKLVTKSDTRVTEREQTRHRQCDRRKQKSKKNGERGNKKEEEGVALAYHIVSSMVLLAIK